MYVVVLSAVDYEFIESEGERETETETERDRDRRKRHKAKMIRAFECAGMCPPGIHNIYRASIDHTDETKSNKTCVYIMI